MDRFYRAQRTLMIQGTCSGRVRARSWRACAGCSRGADARWRRSSRRTCRSTARGRRWRRDLAAQALQACAARVRRYRHEPGAAQAGQRHAPQVVAEAPELEAGGYQGLKGTVPSAFRPRGLRQDRRGGGPRGELATTSQHGVAGVVPVARVASRGGARQWWARSVRGSESREDRVNRFRGRLLSRVRWLEARRKAGAGGAASAGLVGAEGLPSQETGKPRVPLVPVFPGSATTRFVRCAAPGGSHSSDPASRSQRISSSFQGARTCARTSISLAPKDGVRPCSGICATWGNAGARWSSSFGTTATCCSPAPVLSLLKARAPKLEVDALVYDDTAPMLEVIRRSRSCTVGG